MKQLPVQSPFFQQLQTDFEAWLRLLGYAQDSVRSLPLHMRELFYYLEQTGVYHIQALEKAHLSGFFAYLSSRVNQHSGGCLSASYIESHWHALRKLDEYLRETGQWGLTLPPAPVSSPRTPRPIVSQLEIQALYAVCEESVLGQRDRAMLSLFYGCGLRRSEGIGLEVSDLLFEQGLVYVRKGKNQRERYVPLSAAVSQYLQTYLREARPHLLLPAQAPGQRITRAFLLSQQGNPISVVTLAARLRQLRYQTGNPDLIQRKLTLHGLRHSIATHLLQQGMALKQIARFLGHRSLLSTQIYTHLAHESF